MLGLATILLMHSCGPQKSTQGESQLGIKDAELQQYAEGLMKAKSGVVVAVIPATGEVLTSETRLPCNKGFWKDGNRVIGCHDGLANWSLEEALATSCNGYKWLEEK